MATLTPVILGGNADDGTGEPLRDGGIKINANDAALNAELVALLTAVAGVSGAVDMGVWGGTATILTDNITLKAAIEELEAALAVQDNLSVLTLVPGGWDGTTTPTVGSGGAGVLAGDVYLATGTGVFTTDIGVHEVTPKDSITALIDGAAAPADWLYESNKDNVDWVPTADASTLSVDRKYIMQDAHSVTLPALSAAIDGKEIELVSAQANWAGTAATGAVWAPAGADTLNWGAIPLAGGSDVVRLIASFGSTTWLVAVGGPTAPELDQSYNTVGDLPLASTVPAGRRANVLNDAGNEGVYVALGAVGATSATTWQRS